MRFMIQVRTTVTSERGEPPGPELKPLFEEMGAFHEELARAGVLLDAAGLRPSRQGWRQRYHPGGLREVADGPVGDRDEPARGRVELGDGRLQRAQQRGGRRCVASGRSAAAELAAGERTRAQLRNLLTLQQRDPAEAKCECFCGAIESEIPLHNFG